MQVYDDTRCQLGESPLWHPQRDELLWVDILDQRLFASNGNDQRSWRFERPVSAIAWVDCERLIAADSNELFVFDLARASRKSICGLEADNVSTRSNDGRADPWGGFWVGTMGLQAEVGAGAIYRWYGGELRQIARGLTVPNATCFDEDRRRAYFADTVTHRLMTVSVDEDGWPTTQPEVFLDTSDEGLLMDGAITDRAGNIHIACWDASKLITVSPEAEIAAELFVPVQRPTCPAFGGPDAARLYLTSAAVDLDGELDGLTLSATAHLPGKFEPRVVLAS
ncbi:SMP-30/gluconolactonase/LRE family protein (plasmid) [Sphingomonas panni]|uniref:SMP-30/gluconolactonase/LRE family protein n=1 Tax=Sphingomonas hankookensis TaxID=563996 RepID=UPI003D303DDE